VLGVLLASTGCGKTVNSPATDPITPLSYSFTTLTVNGIFNGFTYTNVSYSPIVKLSFSAKLNRSNAGSNIFFKDVSGVAVAYTPRFENGDSTIIIQPSNALLPLNKYTITVSDLLQSVPDAHLQAGLTISLQTQIDSSRKFPVITDDSLLTLVQKQTFAYFWDFAHPVSGLARERNTSNDIVTSGGSGFGIMSIPVAISRNFITRAQGLARMQQIVGFLKNTAQKFHGAFPHWLNGVTGAVVPFSAKDNGADLVETAYLMQGLLTARQYFNGTNADETTLRTNINSLWDAVEWNWFRQNNQNVLYWHWSPTDSWAINMPIKGWNEALITYVLAASSNTAAIPKTVYDQGWASAVGFRNGNIFYNYTLPLGPASGGPLFFEHYSFLGINPNGLTDAYADYALQTRNHTLINYNYCKANPKNQTGYSDSCWGLTASDIANGYTASSPTNDVGVIAPTAALSSFPYTPKESMQALKFFYYVLGDKIWGNYGFRDAFSLNDPWFASSYLAIDQGPIVVMIENYRTGLLWNLFTSCPEIKTGMKALGFQAPYL
jgi:hypothetical protein